MSPRPFLKIKTTPRNPSKTPISPFQLGLCILNKILQMKITTGDNALMIEVNPLGTVCSAMVVKPLARTIINNEGINWYFKLSHPIQDNCFLESKIVRTINAAIPCLIEVINQGGMVSTAIRIPK